MKNEDKLNKKIAYEIKKHKALLKVCKEHNNDELMAIEETTNRIMLILSKEVLNMKMEEGDMIFIEGGKLAVDEKSLNAGMEYFKSKFYSKLNN